MNIIFRLFMLTILISYSTNKRKNFNKNSRRKKLNSGDAIVYALVNNKILATNSSIGDCRLLLIMSLKYTEPH